MTIVILAALVLFGYTILTFNRLTQLRQLGDNAWADIDVQLKRRHDLVPMVVSVVKGHAGYERGTLEAVVDARNRALQASGPAAQAQAEVPLEGSLHRIFALAEAYPELKAVESFRQLQITLTEIEDHLQNARRYYNAVVRDFNTKLGQFPSNLVGGAMGFRTREFFGIEADAERQVPVVKVDR